MIEHNIGAVVLAAGDGTRMKSKHPKVLGEVLFRPMIDWVIDACVKSGVANENICVVVSDKGEAVRAALPSEVKTCIQAERLGTGHAVMMAYDFLADAKERGITQICVLCGDAPFIDAHDLSDALSHHRSESAVVTVLTAVLPDGGSYGRILREENGKLSRIVEKKNATQDILAICEVNSGAYWFDTTFLLETLATLSRNSVTGEIYLTDLVEKATQQGLTASAFVCQNANNVLGANDRKELAKLNEIAKNIVLSTHYDNGVDIPLADGVIISVDTKIGRDTKILPNCIITGNSFIGEDCVIGPNTTIHNCNIGNGVTIEQSKLTDATVGDDARIGPFAQLRPDSFVAKGVKIGNFVEIKNSTLGEKTSVAHLTYIGDSAFGKHVNVGCGVVTVNYDGVKKYRTTVGDHVFVGCNTNLISPVTVGDGAYIAAAATVTEDVAPCALAIGRAKVVQKPNGALKFQKNK